MKLPLVALCLVALSGCGSSEETTVSSSVLTLRPGEEVLSLGETTTGKKFLTLACVDGHYTVSTTTEFYRLKQPCLKELP